MIGDMKAEIAKYEAIAKIIPLNDGELLIHGENILEKNVKKSLSSERFTIEDERIVNQVLNKLDIYNLRDRFLTELSSGQLQKVFLARAIAQETAVILLDEPTSHLDLKAQLEICSELKKITREKNLSVLAVLHDINLALSVADRIILIKDGNLIDDAEIKSFRQEKLNDIYETDVVHFMLGL